MCLITCSARCMVRPHIGSLVRKRADGVIGVMVCLMLAASGCGTSAHEQAAMGASMPDVSGSMKCVLSDIVLDSPAKPMHWSKAEIIEIMKYSQDRAFVPALLTVLSDNVTYKSLQDPAATALGEIGDPAAFEPLKEAVAAGRITKELGVWCLGRLAVSSKDERIVAYVADALANGDNEEVRTAAIGSLRLNSTGMSPVVARALEQSARSDKSIDVRIEAAGWLVSSGRQEFVSVLKDAVASPETSVRRHVVWAIPFSDETTPLLLQLLTDEDYQVAESAWERLSKELGEVNYASPPTSVQQGREMAETYRKAWNASHRK